MSQPDSPASERTPLIRHDEEDHPDVNEPEPNTKKRRIPSFIALSVLCVAVIVALVAGFAVPAVVEQYIKEAITFEPKTLSIESFTDTGVKTRIQGAFFLDADKVQKKSVRDLGRAATWIAHEVESGDANVDVYLPEYGNMFLGSVSMPPVKVDIRNAHYNGIDLVTYFEPGDADGIGRIAKAWMKGHKNLLVHAVVRVPVKSGIFSLGTKVVTQSMRIDGGNEKMPEPVIEKLEVAEYGLPGHPKGIKAVADVSINNTHPVKFDVPSIVMEILLPDCADDYLVLGTMKTDVIHILPNERIHARSTALMQQLPTSLTSVCPDSNKSPLDHLVSAYLEGKEAQVFVRGGEQAQGTPAWIGKMLRDAVLPVPVPVQPVKNMVKNFTLSNVHFNLPEPTAEPGTPEAQPKLSATITVVVGLPPNMSLGVEVDRVRADADMYYKGQRMGKLGLQEWQKSNSSKHGDELWVTSSVIDAPLEITDQDVFTKVVQSMIFGGKGLTLGMKAKVDVNSVTALGNFTVRNIPSEGEIKIDPIGGDGGFPHEVRSIEVVGSSPEELIMQANVRVMNPTEYSAKVPYMNVSLWHNDTQLGYGWGSISIVPGQNDISVRGSWASGAVGRELLSQYISGWNTTLTIRSHENSIPGLPDPKMEVTVPMPHTFGKLLKETTMHLLSSTATFVLFSPIPMMIMTITSSAFYNGTEIGTINYDNPFEVIVGDTETPRLPVAWNSNGGFGLIRDALGGTLKLDARAQMVVEIGNWRESLWYQAKGLGAKVRL